MAKKVYEENNIRAIAERIRSKTGTGKLYKVSDMPTGIDEVFAAGGIGGESGNLLGSLIDRSVTAIIIPDSVSVIGKYAFFDCTSLASVTIGNSVTSIDNNAFFGCRSLASITIPDSVTSIGEMAFYNCTSLASVTIGNSVTSIDNNAFCNCTSLASITIPDSVTVIGWWAFQNCSSLASVTIGNSVTSIGNNAFQNCPAEFDFSRCTSVPSLESTNCFTKGDGLKIIVPSSLYDEWISATNWTVFKDHIVSKDVKAPPKKDNFDVFIGAELLQETVNTAFREGVGNNEILYDNTTPYLRIYGDGSSSEAYSHITDIEGKVTGKYLVFAYRLPASNAETHGQFEVYANTTGDELTGNGDYFKFATVKDGKWQVVAIDIAEAIANTSEVVNGTATSKFIANSDGTYGIKNFRLDWFNQITSTDSYIDIAYVGICDSLEKARQADANYTGKCYEPDDFVSKLGASKAVKGSYNGMPYVTITDTTQASGEQFDMLHRSDHILPDTSRYIGILYRNAPGQYAEIYISSDNVNWIANCQINYDVSDGWHFGVMAIGSEVYRDSVCRRLRFDYFNFLSASTQYSIDIGFVKFFSTEEEANDYYQIYKTKYNI